MDQKKLKIKKRAQGLLAVGAIPSTILGFACDLFTPKGGWVVLGAIGIISLLIATYLFILLITKGQRIYDSWWYKLIAEVEDSKWIWNPSPAFMAHGLHVVVMFGVISLYIAGKSFAAAPDGGILAKNLDAVSAAQKQLGISEKILSELKENNATLEKINNNTNNLKLETSNDPIKELANRGTAWSVEELAKAISRGDEPIIALFLQGGMNPFAITQNQAAIAQMVCGDNRIKTVALLKQFGIDLNAPFTESVKIEGIRVNQATYIPIYYFTNCLKDDAKFVEAMLKAGIRITPEMTKSVKSHYRSGNWHYRAAAYFPESLKVFIKAGGLDPNVYNYAFYKMTLAKKEDGYPDLPQNIKDQELAALVAPNPFLARQIEKESLENNKPIPQFTKITDDNSIGCIVANPRNLSNECYSERSSKILGTRPKK